MTYDLAKVIDFTKEGGWVILSVAAIDEVEGMAGFVKAGPTEGHLFKVGELHGRHVYADCVFGENDYAFRTAEGVILSSALQGEVAKFLSEAQMRELAAQSYPLTTSDSDLPDLPLFA